MPADLTPTDAALLDRWAGALARLAEGPTEYGPHDVGALAATTERLVVENARLRSELAEALATLANERGEGEPPCEGWIPLLEVEGDIEEGNVCVTRWACAMADGIVCYAGVNAFVGGAWWALHRKVERRTVFLLTGDVDTVRNAMRAASAAKGGAR